jgi:hypothetical protein
MSAEVFDAAVRSAAVGGSRRAALGGLIAALIATADPGEGGARRYKDPRRKRRGETRNRRDKDERNEKDTRKNKRKKKDKQSTSKGCKVKHSEKEILDFIAKAAKKYNQSNNAMVRVARCESSLNPCAYSKSGPYYGLYQFLKSTWKTTPYKDKDIYDPEAQALATAWMWKQGRKNEWACQ